MAERRMLSKKVESAKFLKMPSTSQNLYFHLIMNADDDGVVEVYSVMNLVKANEDDLRVLIGKDYVKVLNEDLVTYIIDWQEQKQTELERKIIQLNHRIEELEKEEIRSQWKSERITDLEEEVDKLKEPKETWWDGAGKCYSIFYLVQGSQSQCFGRYIS